MGPHSEIMQTHGFLKTQPKKKKKRNQEQIKKPKKRWNQEQFKKPNLEERIKKPDFKPYVSKFKSKEGFDLLPAMVKQKSMQDQNLGSIPTINTHDQNPRSKPKSMHESKPIVGFATAEQRRSNDVFLPQVESAMIVSSKAHCRSE